ncbi:MAG: tRNA dihydrouridine synthase DusB, partial [Candidatus Omnitrophica bacterium]|nr:tRNA dihydrouridine synthase DusB [Candidatus Omnitrophota bacterium]
MAGCSDLAFRLIAREHGAKLCFYEMVDSNSLI